jgi:hypothetical protein
MTETLLDPHIHEMHKAALSMIHDGDNDGYLALYWINEWIKSPSVTYDEDLWEKGIKQERATDAHPNNFGWRFNNSCTELNDNSRGYHAISKAYKRSGGLR